MSKSDMTVCNQKSRVTPGDLTTTIVGAVILKDKVLISQWLGLGLMLSGICAIAWGKKCLNV
ncbi:MAG: hypothetical protein PUP91_19790 [Rhizonema sp. PD37]|nr:hypothetical protein [Rhizonema sp. PD37]